MRQAEWLAKTLVYSLDARSFQDRDGDGLGDLRGLIARLDYLKELVHEEGKAAKSSTACDVSYG